MNGFGVKVDHHINSNNVITGRYIFGDSLQSAPAFAGLPAGGNNPADLFNSVAPSRTQMAGVSHTINIGNNKILESRFGFQRFAQIITVNNHIDPKTLGVDTGPLDAADLGVPYVYLYNLGYGGYIGGVQGYPITTRPDQTYDWSEHFSWIKGNHSFKFGGNYQTAYTNSLRNRARTGLVAGYYTNSVGEIEQLLLGKADLADRNFGDTHRHLNQKSFGFYGQDEWKIRPRLTLTLGLRWEMNGCLGRERTISEPTSCLAAGWSRWEMGSAACITKTPGISVHAWVLPGTFSGMEKPRCAAAIRWLTTWPTSAPSRPRIASPVPARALSHSRSRDSSRRTPLRSRVRPASVPLDPASTCIDPNNPSVGGGLRLLRQRHGRSGLWHQSDGYCAIQRFRGSEKLQDTAGAQLQLEHAAGDHHQPGTDRGLLRQLRTEIADVSRPQRQPNRGRRDQAV